MLKIYNTLDEVPEALREHYKKSDGRYVPDLSEDHPVLVHNKTLLTEKSTATARAKELEADIAATSEKSIPRGHTAVPKADAELLDKYKAHGTPDEVGAKLAEHKTLAEELTTRKRNDSLRQLSKDLGLNEDAFIRLPGLPEFESRTGKDGKTEWVAKIKGDNNTFTEKPAKEFIESSPDVAPFLPALKSNSERQVQLPGSSMTTAAQPGGDPFAWAKQFAADHAKQNPATTQNLYSSFGIGKEN